MATMTVAPGDRRWPPSTTSWSPGFRPSLTNQLSPCQSPTTSGRCSALPWLFSTQAKWPLAPCCTARCGTRIASGRTPPFRRARTYWLGRSTPLGLSTVARIRKVPVCALYDGSAKVILPVKGKTLPSGCTISTTRFMSAGSFSRPSRMSFWTRRYSFSDRLKLTHIGVSTDTVVSWLFCGLR